MKTNFEQVAHWRVEHPTHGSGDGLNGAFMIPLDPQRRKVACVIASTGEISGWEHVSVHIEEKHNGKFRECTPSWEEMCRVKDLFWEPQECVVQFHVPASDHINIHPHVLHLWRKLGAAMELPPPACV
jgi:hypothetical protein